MRILEMRLKKGYAKVVPITLDDLWHLYNLIYEGDCVYAKTTREIKIDELYARPKEGRRISVVLGIRVKEVYWDRSLNRLRVHGVISEAPETIGIGAHHTLNIVVNRPLTIVKSRWQKHQIDRLKKASQAEAPVIVVASMDDEEYCVAVLRQYGVEVKAEKRTRLPGKLQVEKRGKAMKSFFQGALQALQGTWSNLHCPIAVLGPGFVKNDFVKYVRDKAPDVAASIVDVKGVNSAGVAAVHEALRSGVLTKTLKHVRIAEETKLVEELLARLGKGTNDATYGLQEVARATEFGAVEKLLLTDRMLREASEKDRRSLESIMKEVEAKAGEITVVSVEHEAGTELEGLGSIAALLRFPIV